MGHRGGGGAAASRPPRAAPGLVVMGPAGRVSTELHTGDWRGTNQRAHLLHLAAQGPAAPGGRQGPALARGECGPLPARNPKGPTLRPGVPSVPPPSLSPRLALYVQRPLVSTHRLGTCSVRNWGVARPRRAVRPVAAARPQRGFYQWQFSRATGSPVCPSPPPPQQKLLFSHL